MRSDQTSGRINTWPQEIAPSLTTRTSHLPSAIDSAMATVSNQHRNWHIGPHDTYYGIYYREQLRAGTKITRSPLFLSSLPDPKDCPVAPPTWRAMLQLHVRLENHQSVRGPFSLRPRSLEFGLSARCYVADGIMVRAVNNSRGRRYVRSRMKIICKDPHLLPTCSYN
ncbi:hypothetical protein EJ06DRAFT_261766 [Trichodelitschia bisporula]|uniref:Uncharacterized protein n=1 Tax=Trichodelitschia bisporula TaxID=703511 RepID=A0A6G1HIR0_9PEZI|nr:hypothetical protein EJ06DRAFT_261766 [Trichodelitschia bisporula]